ncbi:MAG: hypothetical protein L3J83_05915 [Proteobacteria bacterium]|nr:hypothetical protein [Pseudomonadota bacterium]
MPYDLKWIRKFGNMPPDLRGTKFNVPLDLSGIKYDENSIIEIINSTNDNTNNEAVFRLLKKISEQNNDHLRALEYFSFEMRSLEKISDNFKISSYFYKYFSNYGRSFKRPIAWMLVFFQLFFVINMGLVADNKVACDVNYPVEVYTLNNISPFGLGIDSKTTICAARVFGRSEIIPVNVQLINLTHKIINLLLWFLLLLAFKNRFKI